MLVAAANKTPSRVKNHMKKKNLLDFLLSHQVPKKPNHPLANNPSIQENKCHQETVTRALNFGGKKLNVFPTAALCNPVLLCKFLFFFFFPRHCRAFPLPVSGRLVVLDGEGFLVRKAILSGQCFR